MSANNKFLQIIIIINLINNNLSSDITNLIFGKITDGMPAAFGDFNSDELTDIFVLRDNGTTLEILLAYEEEPLLRVAYPKPLRCKFKSLITSVVPGDFDGDALMDVLVTTLHSHKHDHNDERIHPQLTDIYIIWGGANYLNCTNYEKIEPLIKMIGQPLAIDYNQDMIIDLFGQDSDNKRMFWVFNNSRGEPEKIPMRNNYINSDELRIPHSHAFLDLNNDYMSDLFLTTKNGYELWLGNEFNKEKFIFNKFINYPNKTILIGQSLFMDVELKGQMDLVQPVCFDLNCENSALFVYSNNQWHNLQINFKDDNNIVWGFYLKSGSKYTDTITLHNGDFNLDGYPDILVTLSPVGNTDHAQSFLLENVPCQIGCNNFKRTYTIKWNILNTYKNVTAMAAFFDFYQDGILDIILVTFNGKEYKSVAFKNGLDYDANFIKIMVLTGLSNQNNQMIMGRLGKKRRTYGTNLPGPLISYRTTTQEGNSRSGVSAQLPQSAHFSLNLPYTIFGLGRTPNFVDSLIVGLSNYSRCWTQIIPNSQMVVIPWPSNQPSKWKAQLFVTPSKLILMSVAALTGICGLITIIIGVLHWKERQEDKKERLSESHRFHFDAM